MLHIQLFHINNSGDSRKLIKLRNKAIVILFLSSSDHMIISPFSVFLGSKLKVSARAMFNITINRPELETGWCTMELTFQTYQQTSWWRRRPAVQQPPVTVTKRLWSFRLGEWVFFINFIVPSITFATTKERKNYPCIDGVHSFS